MSTAHRRTRTSSRKATSSICRLSTGTATRTPVRPSPLPVCPSLTHSVHLHGHKYQIVRVAQDVSSSDPALNPPHTEGAPNPMRRDTVVVPAGGAVNLRFVADNPGAWICESSLPSERC